MIFSETPLRGAFVIEPERIEDERGFFARIWTGVEFADRGLNPALVQSNVAFNRARGTLRGMHFQKAPHQEAKLVRCTMGSIQDVIIDLRAGSPTFSKWTSVVLSSGNRLMLYVPEDFAHGYITLEDSTEVFYQMSQLYHPESASGVRWDDPAFGIRWQIEPVVMNARDRGYPAFHP